MMKKQFALLALLHINLSAQSNYLDLLKKCLLNTIYEDPTYHGCPYDPVARLAGRDWPAQAHTMIGKAGLDNIQACIEDIIRNNIPGDLIEAGVWRGGSAIFMRAVLNEYNITDRFVWVADSFQGLPTPNPTKYPADTYNAPFNNHALGISLETVKGNFAKYDLLDGQVKFLKGWFKDTLPTAPIEHLALLRLDGDLYESTMDTLVSLYPKLSVGGYIVIDDYEAMKACAQAVHDYRNAHNITEPIERAGWSIVYWKKTK